MFRFGAVMFLMMVAFLSVGVDVDIVLVSEIFAFYLSRNFSRFLLWAFGGLFGRVRRFVLVFRGWFLELFFSFRRVAFVVFFLRFSGVFDAFSSFDFAGLFFNFRVGFVLDSCWIRVGFARVFLIVLGVIRSRYSFGSFGVNRGWFGQFSCVDIFVFRDFYLVVSGEFFRRVSWARFDFRLFSL